MFSPSIPSFYQESALKHCPETAVNSILEDSAFQLLQMEATQFDRLLFAEILTADIQPSDMKGLDWIRRG